MLRDSLTSLTCTLSREHISHVGYFVCQLQKQVDAQLRTEMIYTFASVLCLTRLLHNFSENQVPLEGESYLLIIANRNHFLNQEPAKIFDIESYIGLFWDP